MIAATATPVTRGRFHGVGGREEASAAPNKRSVAGAAGGLTCLANGVNDSVRDPNLSSGRVWRCYLPILPYLLDLACGRWGTVRFRGGRRPAWSGLTFSPSPSLDDRRPAVAWRVRSLARRSFLAARAVLRASESWVSFIGTTRRRASSSRTSTSARVSSRSM